MLTYPRTPQVSRTLRAGLAALAYVVLADPEGNEFCVCAR
jgi:hypothetical protein